MWKKYNFLIFFKPWDPLCQILGQGGGPNEVPKLQGRKILLQRRHYFMYNKKITF